jgi:hypothetical protein
LHQAGSGPQAAGLRPAPAQSGPVVSPRRFSVSGAVTRTASSLVQGVVRGLLLTETGASIPASGPPTHQDSTTIPADGSSAARAAGDPGAAHGSSTTSSYTYMLAFETSLDALRWAHAAQVCADVSPLPPAPLHVLACSATAELGG